MTEGKPVSFTLRMPGEVRRAMRLRATEEGITDAALVLKGLKALGLPVPDDAVQDRRATRHKRKETP